MRKHEQPSVCPYRDPDHGEQQSSPSGVIHMRPHSRNDIPFLLPLAPVGVASLAPWDPRIGHSWLSQGRWGQWIPPLRVWAGSSLASVWNEEDRNQVCKEKERQSRLERHARERVLRFQSLWFVPRPAAFLSLGSERHPIFIFLPKSFWVLLLYLTTKRVLTHRKSKAESLHHLRSLKGKEKFTTIFYPSNLKPDF